MELYINEEKNFVFCPICHSEKEKADDTCLTCLYIQQLIARAGYDGELVTFHRKGER